MEQLGQMVWQSVPETRRAIPGEVQGQQLCDESDRSWDDWFLYQRFTVTSRGVLRNGADDLMLCSDAWIIKYFRHVDQLRQPSAKRKMCVFRSWV